MGEGHFVSTVIGMTSKANKQNHVGTQELNVLNETNPPIYLDCEEFGRAKGFSMAPTTSRSIFGTIFFSTVSLACFVYCFASVFKLALFLSTDLLGKDSLKGGPASSHDKKDGDGDFLSNPLVQDVGLLLLFPLQHLVMTSWLVKRLLSAVRLDVVERSLYVASTALVLQVAIDNWKTVGGSDPFWDFPVKTSQFLWLVFTLVHIFGWLSISGSAVILDYPEMMGVKQAYYYALGLDDPLSIKSESVRQFYSNNRLPIFTGVMMVLWLIPCMTLDRLVLAAFWTLYLLLWQSLSVNDYVYMCVMLDRKREALRARLTIPSILFFLLRTSLIVVTLACVAVVLYLITCLYMWLLVPIVILSVFTLFALYHAITNSGPSTGISTHLGESVVILVSATALALGVLYPQFWPAFWAGVALLWCLARSAGSSLSTQVIVMLLSGGAAVYLGVYYQLWWAAVWVGVSMLCFLANQVGVSFSGSTSPAAGVLTLASVASALLGYLYGQWIPAAVMAAVVALLLLRQFGVSGVSVRTFSLPIAALLTLLLLTALVASIAVGFLYGDWIPAGVAGVLAAGALAKQHGLTSTPTFSLETILLLVAAASASAVAIGVLYSQWIPAAVVAVIAAGVVAKQQQWVSFPETSPAGIALPLLLLAAVVGTAAVGVMYAQWIPAAIAVAARRYLIPLTLLLAAGSSAAVWALYGQWIPAAIIGVLATGYLLKRTAALESLPSVAAPSRASLLPGLLLTAAISSVAWIPAAVSGVSALGYVTSRCGLTLPSPSSASLLQTAQAGLHVLIPVGAVAVGVVYGVWIPAGIVGVLFVVHGAHHYGLTSRLPTMSAVPYIPLLLLLALAGSIAAGLLYNTWVPAGLVGVLTVGYIVKKSGLTASLPSLPNPSLPALSTIPLSAVVFLLAASSAIAIGVLYAQWIPTGIVGVLMLAYIANHRGLFQSFPSISLPPRPNFPYRPVSLFLGAVCSLVASSLASSGAGAVYVPWILAGIVAVVVGYLAWKYFLPAVSQTSLPHVPRGAVILVLGAAAALAAGILYAQWIPAAVVCALAAVLITRKVWPTVPTLAAIPRPSLSSPSLAVGSLTLGSASAVAIGVLYAQWIPLGVVAALGVTYILGQKGVFAKVPKLTPSFSLSKDVLILVMATVASLLLGYLYNQWWSAIAAGVAILWYVTRRMGVSASLPSLTLPKPSLPKLNMSRTVAEVSLLSAATVTSVLLGVYYGQWIPLACSGIAITWYVLRNKGVQVSLPAGLQLDPLAQSLTATTLIFLSLAVLFEAWLIVWATLVALAVIIVSKTTSLVSYVKSIEVRTLLSTLGTRLREAYTCASTMDVLNGSLWYERLSRYAVVVGMVLACLAVAWRFSALEMSLVLVALLLTAQVADHYRWGADGIRVATEQETQ
ncbi:hypothetical protein Bbelb_226180 [Branchiostoma belcheri]|nr:hypothetical protein Bbelb_226180 [Branchiostoma belcheri]